MHSASYYLDNLLLDLMVQVDLVHRYQVKSAYRVDLCIGK